MPIRTSAKFLFATALAFGAQVGQAQPFAVEAVAAFDEPWAVVEMPDGRLLVTETKGSLRVVTPEGQKSRAVSGVPDVVYGGQGGLGDVALHPDFADNGVIYLSYGEAGVVAPAARRWHGVSWMPRRTAPPSRALR